MAATADRAPPPLAWPSNLVIITLPISTALLKATAWSWHAWPMWLSITKIMSLGCIAAETCFISSKRASSCLCLPEVSTIIISYFSFLNLDTPSSAILTGSISV